MNVDVVRVFVNVGGKHGNPLGILLEPSAMDVSERLAVTKRLGFAETVFVDSVDEGRIEIYSPSGALPFAGHPLVGTGWLLNELTGGQLTVLRPPAGDVPFWIENESAWIVGRVEDCPAWRHVQLSTPENVESLEGPVNPTHDAVQYWAWRDASAGCVRARVFGARFGIDEDEACGSASMMLAHQLDREIEILHGLGSIIYARPSNVSGQVAVGGRVTRDMSIPL